MTLRGCFSSINYLNAFMSRSLSALKPSSSSLYVVAIICPPPFEIGEGLSSDFLKPAPFSNSSRLVVLDITVFSPASPPFVWILRKLPLKF